MKTFPKPLSQMEEKECLERCKGGDQSARNMLIEHNMRLVAHVVKKYQCPDYETEDLLSVGTIGLIKAVNTFNADKGHKLVTYAARCIENEILMLLRSEKKLVREVSLYEPIGTDKEGNEINLLDIMESEETDMAAQIALSGDVKRLYKLIDKVLTKREKMIVSKRYGLYQQTPVTQREIAKTMGISRSYVSRIEKRAVEKLRQSF